MALGDLSGGARGQVDALTDRAGTERDNEVAERFICQLLEPGSSEGGKLQ